MRSRRSLVPALAAALALLAASPGVVPPADAQQKPPAAGSKPSRARALAGKLADTAMTSAASLGADSLLGARAPAVAQMVAGSGGTRCAPRTGAAAAAASLAGAPTAGGLLVSAAKKRLLKGKQRDTTVRADGAAGPCPDSAAGGPSALQTVGAAALAASPAGMAVAGAAAAAPHAGKAIRSLRGRLRRGGESRESMQQALASGRLEVKGIAFAAGSTEPAEGFEPTIAQLVTALQAGEGRFALFVAAEAKDPSAPDVEIAAKRATAIAMHLRLAGLDGSRVTVGAPRDPSAPAPAAPGEARVVLVKMERP